MDLPPILERMKLDVGCWKLLIKDFGRLFSLVAAAPTNVYKMRSLISKRRFNLKRLIGISLRQANHLLIDPNQVYRLMVVAKGLRSQSRYCSAGTDKVAPRAVSALEGRNLTTFLVSFASAMQQLECKSGVSPRFSSCIVRLELQELVSHFERFSIRTTRWIESHPSSRDLQGGPLGSLLNINAEQEMEMVIHDAESTDRDSKDPIKFL